MNKANDVNSKAVLAAQFNDFYLKIALPEVNQIGSYKILDEIGEGAFGKVYLARHVLLNVKVVLKCGLLDDPNIVREVYYHRQLKHKHIVKLYEVIKTESHLWLVLEYCEGNELFYYIYEQRRVEYKKCQELFFQIMLAIKYVHSLNLAHRDLKLENILLADTDKTIVKLTDFGFVREFNPYSRQFLSTVCGTTAYMAPEVLQNIKYLGFQIDIWALGVILYTMLYGRMPFDEDDDLRTKYKILNEEPPYYDTIPRETIALIQRMLSKDPANRPNLNEILNSPFLIDYNNKHSSRTRLSYSTDTESILSLNQYYKSNPVPFQSKIEKNLMYKLEKLGIDIEELLQSIYNNEMNSLTAFYELLLTKEFQKKKSIYYKDRKRRAKKSLLKSKKRVKSVLSLSDVASATQPLERIISTLSISSRNTSANTNINPTTGGGATNQSRNGAAGTATSPIPPSPRSPRYGKSGISRPTSPKTVPSTSSAPTRISTSMSLSHSATAIPTHLISMDSTNTSNNGFQSMLEETIVTAKPQVLDEPITSSLAVNPTNDSTISPSIDNSSFTDGSTSRRKVSFHTNTHQRLWSSNNNNDLNPEKEKKSKGVLNKLQFWKKGNNNNNTSSDNSLTKSRKSQETVPSKSSQQIAPTRISLDSNNRLTHASVNPKRTGPRTGSVASEESRLELAVPSRIHRTNMKPSSSAAYSGVDSIPSPLAIRSGGAPSWISESPRGPPLRRQRPSSMISQISQFSQQSQMSESELDILDASDMEEEEDLEEEEYDEDLVYESSINMSQDFHRPSLTMTSVNPNSSAAPSTNGSTTKLKRPGVMRHLSSDISIASSTTSAAGSVVGYTTSTTKEAKKRLPSLTQLSSNSSEESEYFEQLAAPIPKKPLPTTAGVESQFSVSNSKIPVTSGSPSPDLIRRSLKVQQRYSGADKRSNGIFSAHTPRTTSNGSLTVGLPGKFMGGDSDGFLSMGRSSNPMINRPCSPPIIRGVNSMHLNMNMNELGSIHKVQDTHQVDVTWIGTQKVSDKHEPVITEEDEEED
ncbi:uncharacterized protein KQ657_002027 [Scheffersomyces spartinae]|uniref:non-specific serine/threonine protein kinase n=1 Tax=Scheffersomyces spartinae TaxID=45513 RepID=A0A9P7V6J8_9ASCO|nr:uncharacterized protein KQ657_002027 [Scheffersomyces spartinae]KAG7192308.1 hypothetical protein KQ657_002027 [Scheffersomyces spartinae]